MRRTVTSAVSRLGQSPPLWAEEGVEREDKEGAFLRNPTPSSRRGPGAEAWAQRAGHRGLGAEGRAQRPGRRGPGAEGWAQRAGRCGSLWGLCRVPEGGASLGLCYFIAVEDYFGFLGYTFLVV